jgi:DTW domain-containing protein YfiP
MIPLAEYPPPPVTLPIALEIVHHPVEKKSKSTAVHACVLCPSQTRMWEFPDFPTFDPAETLCLFPSPDAKNLTEIDLTKFKRAVVIDCTWTQTFPIRTVPRIMPLTKVKLTNHKSLFWRFKRESCEFLSTIEAIYFFFKEYTMAANGGRYAGEVDNLLWYYVFQYENIQVIFERDKEKIASKRWAPDYVRAKRSKLSADPAEIPGEKPVEADSSEKP